MFDKLVKIFDDFTKGDRVQELAQLAKEEGLSIDKRQSFSKQTTEIKSFKAFKGKGTKRLIGILSRPPNGFKGKIRFYDYLKTKDLETKSHSIVELYLEEIDTEYLIIEPKGAIKKMKNLFLSAALPFPDLKEFHKKFEITCEEEEDLYLLKRSALSLMVQFPGITCEALGNYMLFYYRKKTIEVQDILPTLQFAEEFINLLLNDDSEDFV